MADQGEYAAEPVASRDRLIHNMAELMAGLAVPVSMPMPLGKARQAWTELHSQLHAFGWASADQYEKEIRRELGL